MRAVNNCPIRFLISVSFNHPKMEKTMGLAGSKTEQNLKDAFAGESQANRRYLYFAQKADIEGYNDVAAVFRSTAEGETGHAHGHLEFLEEVGDPATGEPIGGTDKNLKAAIDEVMRLKPSSSKGRYLQKGSVSTTFGPGIPLDVNAI